MGYADEGDSNQSHQTLRKRGDIAQIGQRVPSRSRQIAGSTKDRLSDVPGTVESHPKGGQGSASHVKTHTEHADHEDGAESYDSRFRDYFESGGFIEDEKEPSGTNTYITRFIAY